ncbi:MAG: TIGR02117 family protein [Sphingomonas adhaesiva]|uniref:TIGR02117 family protein n=1 Tax=Sphingomonas adhaesiva TaxID=28212 RepID=UPI002FF64CFE
MLAVALAVLGYAIAGAIGGLVPRNPDWRAPADGVTIWVEDNGIHTGLVLPVRAAGIDWRGDFPARDLRDPRYADHGHVAVGWGERGFYLGTPTWWDVRPSTILRAALGSDDTLLHVEHIARPVAGPQVRAVTLRREEYRRLAAVVRGSRRRGAAVPGYAGYDVFYPASGRYDAVRTCNAWTGDALAAAGVRVGAWTPFPSTVMRWF